MRQSCLEHEHIIAGKLHRLHILEITWKAFIVYYLLPRLLYISHKEYSVKMKNIKDSLRNFGHTAARHITCACATCNLAQARKGLDMPCSKSWTTRPGSVLRPWPNEKNKSKKVGSLEWWCEEKGPHSCAGHLSHQVLRSNSTSFTAFYIIIYLNSSF